MLIRDVEILDSYPTTLLLDKHIKFLHGYASNPDSPEQIMVEYLKMSGIYWGISALQLMSVNPSEGKS